MQVELGARVYSRDDREIGVIKNLILDPESEQVKTVVIEKGLLRHDDIEAPLEAVLVEAPNRARLTYTAEETQRLPRFDAARYTQAPAEQATRLPGFPTAGLLTPSLYMASLPPTGIYPDIATILPEGAVETDNPERAEILRELDRQNAVIAAGSDVISQEGEKVGTVQSVTFDTQTGQPTALVVSRGLLFTEHVELPARAIVSVDDDTVYLNLTKAQLQQAAREPSVPLF
ncbi:MAG TPA: PRC-barrel domain-containing protein [Chthonomonadaceae bacterium]|nr:PRC-barrel domain-containing protein [Chthonomonadaceae bacterium]